MFLVWAPIFSYWGLSRGSAGVALTRAAVSPVSPLSPCGWEGPVRSPRCGDAPACLDPGHGRSHDGGGGGYAAPPSLSFSLSSTTVAAQQPAMAAAASSRSLSPPLPRMLCTVPR
ncbi:hypothetical protein SORBI_3009G083500 [Sorghum bicolor]|uniref:Uncharacterized protein n=1 Tax=Sorghum bicolor TaxID=4558 RepID=A0A1B6P7C0_SORBI|nr:hypothetical protein SORBI_3009G083500 [Sorghum bicolor]